MYEDFLYNRLTRLRIKSGVSARDMSLSIGQSSGYINSIENKNFLPSMSEFFNICEYLKLTPKEFFDESMQNPEKLTSLINDLKALNDEQIAHVAAIVKGLKK